MKANREAYGEALVELGQELDNIVVLDADLAKATYTCKFKDVFPDRFIDCGIAESNMMGVAAGLSTVGYIPYVSSFAMFAALRAAEQFRNSVCYPHLNVKVVATHAGIDCGADGATHQALEDLSLMRAIPGNHVIVPSDHVSTKALVKEIAKIDGPCYIRVGRDKNEALYQESETFEIGKSKELRHGNDATIIACGSVLKAALEAADELAKFGKKVRVIDMYSIKPIDKQAIINAASQTKGIVTVEDHQITGGLGSAVTEVTSENNPCKVIRIGMKDCFGRSAPATELYDYFGINSKAIIDAVNKILD